MLWTYIVRCRDCGAELNRAEHVPDEKRSQVSMTGPFNALCKERSHNTFSDLNWNYRGEWVPETDGEGGEEDAVASSEA